MELQKLLSHFNLTDHPFNKTIKEIDLIQFQSFKKAYDSVMLLIETRGIGLLTGVSGCGKSTLLRYIKHSLHAGIHKVFYLNYTASAVGDFYQSLSHTFGLMGSGKKAKAFRELQQRIMTINTQEKIRPVLFIDEAQFLNTDILAELRLLTNYKMDSFPALTLLLCGQEDLNKRFNLAILDSLANSITISASLGSLKEEETYSYIENRINKTGGSQGLFTKNALMLIHQSSNGILRTINTIAFNGLRKAYSMSSEVVEAEHIQALLSR